MPKIEKTLHGDIEVINRKIAQGVGAICGRILKRGVWDTTVGGVRCIHTVFEKYAEKIPASLPHPAPGTYGFGHYDYSDTEMFKPQPHYVMAVTLLENGDEIKLCAITAGGSQEMYFLPGAKGEDVLSGALEITLNQLDNIY